jgi:hypothetical protein
MTCSIVLSVNPDARRLAAPDMWGTAGSSLRRRVIRAEFVVGAIGCTALGIPALVAARTALWFALGVWLVGAGANYVPLALYAQSLAAPGRLEAEVGDEDVRTELRRVGRQQFWIAVPFAVAVAALVNEANARRR